LILISILIILRSILKRKKQSGLDRFANKYIMHKRRKKKEKEKLKKLVKYVKDSS